MPFCRRPYFIVFTNFVPLAICSFTLAACFYGYVLFVRFDYDLIAPSLKAPKILPRNLDKISSGNFSKVALEILIRINL